MTGTKYCNTCKTERPASDFHKCARNKDGLSSNCKNCMKKWNSKWWKENKEKGLQTRKNYYNSHKIEISRKYHEKYIHNIDGYADKLKEKWQSEEHKKRRREYYKKYAENNREKIRNNRLNYQKNNREKVHLWAKKYRENHKEQIRAYGKKYREENRELINKKALDRLHNDPKYKIKEQTRNMIRYALRSNNHKKTSQTKDILGCDLDFFYEYLLSTWEKRYGSKWSGEAYHIDHIIPLSTGETKEEIIKLCHYTNLQMLTPEDNMAKSNRLDWE